MNTEIQTPFQPIFKSYEPIPADGDFDEIARLAKEVLRVPFVYVSLADFRSKSTANGFQNGKGGIPFAHPAIVFMSSQSYLNN